MFIKTYTDIVLHHYLYIINMCLNKVISLSFHCHLLVVGDSDDTAVCEPARNISVI